MFSYQLYYGIDRVWGAAFGDVAVQEHLGYPNPTLLFYFIDLGAPVPNNLIAPAYFYMKAAFCIKAAFR